VVFVTLWEQPGDVIAYRLDAADRLEWVNENWGRFAARNEAPELAAGRVLGRPLWDFLSTPEVHQIYRTVLERVRRLLRPVRFPIRCDSPGLRRSMTLSLTPQAEGKILFECRLDRLETRGPAPLLDPRRPRSEDLLAVCSWCKRVRAGEEWLEIEEAIAALDLFGQECLPRLTHGICPACKERVLAPAL